MIMRTPEPGATRLRQAWLRLRERDRQLAAEIATLPVEIPSAEPAKGIKALKHKLAIEAKARYGNTKTACNVLGVSRFTFYRWLKEAA